jgi:hypothetical protein
MKRTLLAVPSLLLVWATAASAVNLLVPTDFIIGGRSDGINFLVGSAGTDGGATNYTDNVWPAAEPPSDLINGLIWGAGEKYLNFAELNTGVIFTPAAGSSWINTMTLYVANDAVGRDPSSFLLYGTNVPISGPGPFPISDFEIIAGDGLNLPPDRDSVADASGFSETIFIGSPNAYSTYMLIFPTVKDEATVNSMQISELQIDATLVPEPGTAAFAALALCLTARRRR